MMPPTDTSIVKFVSRFSDYDSQVSKVTPTIIKIITTPADYHAVHLQGAFALLGRPDKINLHQLSLSEILLTYYNFVLKKPNKDSDLTQALKTTFGMLPKMDKDVWHYLSLKEGMLAMVGICNYEKLILRGGDITKQVWAQSCAPHYYYLVTRHRTRTFTLAEWLGLGYYLLSIRIERHGYIMFGGPKYSIITRDFGTTEQQQTKVFINKGCYHTKQEYHISGRTYNETWGSSEVLSLLCETSLIRLLDHSWLNE